MSRKAIPFYGVPNFIIAACANEIQKAGLPVPAALKSIIRTILIPLAARGELLLDDGIRGQWERDRAMDEKATVEFFASNNEFYNRIVLFVYDDLKGYKPGDLRRFLADGGAIVRGRNEKYRIFDGKPLAKGEKLIKRDKATASQLCAVFRMNVTPKAFAKARERLFARVRRPE